MSWKKTLATVFGTSSTIIKVGVAGILFIATAILSVNLFIYIMRMSNNEGVDIFTGFMAILCFPITIVFGILFLISLAWAFGGLRQYFNDLAKEDKNKKIEENP